MVAGAGGGGGGAAVIALVNANAVKIPLPDELVHLVVTSPPYWGLRSYQGIEPTLWPEITYVPMAGLAPATVAGCKVGCDHVWGNEQKMAGRVQHGQGASTLTGGRESWGNREGGTQGQFCQRCNGWRGCLGLEPTPEMYVAHIVAIFREVRRVMRDDAVLFLNLGDSYANGGRKGTMQGTIRGLDIPQERPPRNDSIKLLDLLGIPWRIAFALQADGWFLRSDCIWAKGVSFCDSYSGSVMPESVNGWRWERCRVKTAVDRHRNQPMKAALLGRRDIPTIDRPSTHGQYEYTDCPGCPKCLPNDGYILRRGSWRPTKSHEYLFMLAKSERYFCDREAVKEKGAIEAGTYSAIKGKQTYARAFDREPSGNEREGVGWTYTGGRNPRTVWAINPGSYKGAHYAVFPPALVEPCIKAATSEAGVCRECGAQWVRVVEPSADYAQHLGKDWADDEKDRAEGRGHFQLPGGSYSGQRCIKRNAPSLTASYETRGFRPSCTCEAGPPVPATVFDPFLGSGTTAQVARALGRNCIGLDLSAEYLRDQARPRLELDALDEWENGRSGEGALLEELPLFSHLIAEKHR